MIKPKKKTTIANEILDTMQPRELLNPDDDDRGDITKARTEYDDNSDEEDIYQDTPVRASAVRKLNAPDLTQIDERYRGEVVSRAVLEDGSDYEMSSEEENDRTRVNGHKSYSDGESSENENMELGYEDDELDDDDFDSDIDDFGEGFSDDDEEMGDEEQQEEENWSDDDALLQISQPDIIKPENIEERIKKADAVKNQLKLWEKLLEVRIKLQKVLTIVNTLPINETAFDLLQSDEYKQAVEQTSLKMFKILKQLYTLRISLLSQHTESETIASEISEKCQNLTSNSEDLPDLDEIDIELGTNLTVYRPYLHEVLTKWDDRVKLTINPRFLKKMRDVGIVQRITEAMMDKEKLLKKTQIYRGGYEIIGYPIQQPEPESVKKVVVEGVEFKDTNVYVPEIYDDSDFYHQLLRELIEFKSNAAETSTELNQKLTELQRLRNKMKKPVDNRASKGRRIRYVVHNKLVNFMAPVEDDKWTEEAKQDLFRSLFDQALKPSTTTEVEDEKVDTLTYSGLRLL